MEDGAVKFVYYRYDDSGVCGMNYDGTDYYFRKNIFGDIIEVFASDGTSVASFVYDAYGKVLTESGTMASKVPFRYRGYYYDQETRLYYLQSRYYDPATGRFISPDSIEYLDPAVIHGLNLYAYCGNNPVMNVDPDGTFLITIGASISSLIYALGALVVAALIESSQHPIEKAIKGIGAIIDSAIDSNKQDESVNEEFVTVPWELSLNFDICFSRERNRGHDSGLIGKSVDDLKEELKQALKEGNTQYAKRIRKELKMRKIRNTQKDRGGPHMRGFIITFLLKKFLEKYLDEDRIEMFKF